MNFISNNGNLKSRRKYLRNNSTKPEQILWKHISTKKLSSLKFRRQHSFGQYVVDFYCRERKLVIEIDGDNHLTQNAKQYDQERTLFLKSLNLCVLRFTNEKVLYDIENVLQKIITSPNPSYK